jgi:predicted nucleic acid-binding protein
VSAEGLTYDTGALVAAERSDRLVWSLHRAALARGLPPVVPAGVLAEGWRGGPQATLSRFLKGCHVEDLSKEQARMVGGLAARAEHDDVIDVSVVEGAIRRRHAVVTSNPAHIKRVADAAGVTLEIQAV